MYVFATYAKAARVQNPLTCWNPGTNCQSIAVSAWPSLPPASFPVRTRLAAARGYAPSSSCTSRNTSRTRQAGAVTSSQSPARVSRRLYELAPPWRSTSQAPRPRSRVRTLAARQRAGFRWPFETEGRAPFRSPRPHQCRAATPRPGIPGGSGRCCPLPCDSGARLHWSRTPSAGK